MKLWLDDVRPAPDGYYRVKTVPQAKKWIMDMITMFNASGGKEFYAIEVIDLDHDLGECAKYGGDGIELLNWMERHNIDVPIRLHTMNPVGRDNMRAIIQRNGWKEIQ